MLRINRLKIYVIAEDGEYFFDETFDKKINFIASKDNTCGKSSCIEAILYCLGLEELIGGKNEKALKPVFRERLEYKGRQVKVIETKFWLEVQNEKEEIRTFYRTSKDKVFTSNLIRIYEGHVISEKDVSGRISLDATSEDEELEIEKTKQKSVRYYDTYVNLPGSATREKGFHRCLEKFIGLSLPDVFTYDGIEKKLYLQVLFSALFIEQKRGWADIFAGLPTYLKVKEPKKRVVEFLLGLESLENEKNKEKIKSEELDIENEWKNLLSNINFILRRNNYYISGISDKPTILSEEDINNIVTYKKTLEGDEIALDIYQSELLGKLEKLNSGSDTIAENIDELEKKVDIKQRKLMEFEDEIEEAKRRYNVEENIISTLKNNIERIDMDIQNNKDILKLEKYGSVQKWGITQGKCPTCGQKINNSLLPKGNEEVELMDINENIKHLNSQKKMIEFSLNTHKANILNINSFIEESNNVLIKERKILRSIKNDLYTEDKKVSETIVREKIVLENKIESLKEVEEEINKKIEEFKELSRKFKNLQTKKIKLPKERYTESDLEKIKDLRDNFVNNLKEYIYKSTPDFKEIDIDKTKLLPVIRGFDMKFDSSASDNIRIIWAFTIAILQTSISKGGNHPRILIFDEPGQHRIVVNDIISFIRSLNNIENMQCIIGITINDTKTFEAINGLNKEDYKLILIEDKAIKKVEDN